MVNVTQPLCINTLKNAILLTEVMVEELLKKFTELPEDQWQADKLRRLINKTIDNNNGKPQVRCRLYCLSMVCCGVCVCVCVCVLNNTCLTISPSPSLSPSLINQMLYEPVQYVITGKRQSEQDVCAIMEGLGKKECLVKLWTGSFPYLQSIANKSLNSQIPSFASEFSS